MTSTLNRPLALLVAVTFFMENLDGTIIQTAAPTMARDFGVQAVDMNLAMTAYLLTVAVGIPISGWLAERVGVRGVFLVAVAIFTLASAGCALSGSLAELTVLRVVQGVGGAMMVPVGRFAVLRTVRAGELLNAIAYLVWPGLIAPVIAPAVGGILTDTVGWQWIFLINVPLGAAALVAAFRLVPRSAPGHPGPLDWSGFLMIGACLSGLVLGLEELDSSHIPVGVTAALLAVAALGGAAAVLRLRLARHPLLDVSALRTATFRVGNVGGNVYRLLISAAPFLFTLLFQAGFGWSATKAGLLIIAVFAGNIAIKPATSPLIRRFGFRTVLVASNLCGIASYVLCAFLAPSTPVAVIAVLLFLSGVFRSAGFTVYNTIQFTDVAPEAMAGANTLSSTLQQLATGLGVSVAALIATVSGVVVTAVARGGGSASEYRLAFVVVAALLLFPLVESMMLTKNAGSAAILA